ncbi:MAG TPA: metallopeptidase TldD-related protein, partial [Kofleriaceae bacterium]|nr:metallopeptidase TldD-related protein [Kofleriaceae bacterium]
VGDYQFDNSNFVAPGQEELDGRAESSLPIEPSASIARRAAWLATDQAYKEALELIHAKQEALSGGAAGGVSKVPSYTKVKPAAMAEPVLVPKLEPLADLRARAEKISAVFRKEGHIRDSRVAFTSYLERRWLLNTEGNSVHDTRRASGVLIVASAQANDGQELSLYYTRYGITAKDLPEDEELIKEAKLLAARLQNLIQAPLVENYTGPVLFEADGAVGMLRNTLALDLSGTPLPVGVSGADATRFGGELNERIGLKVLSDLLTIVDDPTARTAEKKSLIGGYKIDDEGVPAQKVSVVENGKLAALLMSRTPSKQVPATNGHARLSMPGGVYRGSTTNMLVTGKGGVDRKALVKKLLAEAKAQGLPHAIIIRQFDDAAITSNSELTRFERLRLLQSADQQAPPPAVLAYRVYPNGKEELVRGVQLKPVGMRAWRDVIAVGKERTVRNFLASTEDPLLQQVNGGGPGFVPSAGVESAVVTPDLLFRELDIVPNALGQRAAPAIPPP